MGRRCAFAAFPGTALALAPHCAVMRCVSLRDDCR